MAITLNYAGKSMTVPPHRVSEFQPHSGDWLDEICNLAISLETKLWSVQERTELCMMSDADLAKLISVTN